MHKLAFMHMCIRNTCFSSTLGTRLFYGWIDLHLQTFVLIEKNNLLSFISLPSVVALHHFCTSLECILQRHTDIYLVIPLSHLCFSIFLSSVFFIFFLFDLNYLFLYVSLDRLSQHLSSSDLIKNRAAQIHACKYLDEKCTTRLTDRVGKYRQKSHDILRLWSSIVLLGIQYSFTQQLTRILDFYLLFFPNMVIFICAFCFCYFLLFLLLVIHLNLFTSALL